MANAIKTSFDDSTHIDEVEDDVTLAAIDEGVRDAEAGRTVSTEEVRKLLPQGLTASDSPRER